MSLLACCSKIICHKIGITCDMIYKNLWQNLHLKIILKLFKINKIKVNLHYLLYITVLN